MIGGVVLFVGDRALRCGKDDRVAARDLARQVVVERSAGTRRLDQRRSEHRALATARSHRQQRRPGDDHPHAQRNATVEVLLEQEPPK